MPQLTTAAEFDAYAENPRRYVAITDTAGTTVHKVSCRHVRRSFIGRYFAVASVREAYEQFASKGCSDRNCTTAWDIAHLKQQATS